MKNIDEIKKTLMNQWESFIIDPVHILVVDDEEIILLIMNDILKSKGATTYLAKNGREAIELFKNNTIDIILMDLNMPVINGFEAISSIRNLLNGKFLPIITVSAFNNDEKLLKRALQCGADDLLAKPVNADVLIAKINVMLRTKLLYDKEFYHRKELDMALQKTKQLTRQLLETQKKLEIQNDELIRANIKLDDHQHKLQEQVSMQMEQLRQQDLQLIQKDREVSLYSLASGMAHEINNPLGFIKSSLVTLEKKLEKLFNGLSKESFDTSRIEKEHASVKKAIQRAFRGMNRIIDIITQLKSFVNLDMENTGTLSLNRCIEENLLLQNTLIENSINVNTQLAEIPDIYCSKRDVKQSIFNVLKNSVDAINEKQNKNPDFKDGNIYIETREIKEENQTNNNQEAGIIVKIKDNGIGMSQETIRSALNPFFTTKPIGQGSGLGLAMADSCMKKHQGSLTFESKINIGTTVILFFPVHGKLTI